jgi:hypothetical protein
VIKGNYEHDLTQGHHRLEVNTTIPLLVCIDEQPVAAIAPGKFNKAFRGKGKLTVQPSDAKTLYGCKVISSHYTEYEKVDDIPPPAPPAPENFLAQIREKVRQSMGVTREGFAEHRSIYEMGDVDVFEEDLQRAPESATDSPSDDQAGSPPETPEPPSDAPESESQA